MSTMNFKRGMLVEVPVMRNGIPTKRMKKEWVDSIVALEVEEIIIEGKAVYAVVEDKYFASRVVYNNDAEEIYANWIYGRSGEKLHKEILRIDRNNEIIKSSGYQGATGKGWSTRLKNIIW